MMGFIPKLVYSDKTYHIITTVSLTLSTRMQIG